MKRYRVAFEISEIHSPHEPREIYANKAFLSLTASPLTHERAEGLANNMFSDDYDGWRVDSEVDAETPIEASKTLNRSIELLLIASQQSPE